MRATLYGSRPISRVRRTAAEMDDIRAAIAAVLESYHPLTVRQCFYQLVSRGTIAKTEQEYKTVVRLLTEMRRRGQIPFGYIADNTRWMRKPTTHDSIKQMLEYSQRTYRRSIWNDQESYVEVWHEKDALAGVLYEETKRWDVPLMVTRGYPSVSYLYGAAEAIAAQMNPTFIYYFGDHDPSGQDITRTVEAGLREFAPDADITFARVAVTDEQIRLFRLATRPTKATDSRVKHFEGESVEVDAIDPLKFREIVRDCIERHIDQDALRRTEEVEEMERESLGRLIIIRNGNRNGRGR